jgi:NAD(P)-dependent dehydrogenase (short-subunit alcohol dehydrogenase family)
VDQLARAGKYFIQVPYTPGRLLRRLRRGSLEDAVKGRVVLITGASSGIGRAAASRVGAAGGTVLLVARTPQTLMDARDEVEAVGGVAHVYPCDLTSLEDIDRMATEVLAEHGSVDVLVNNAGRSIRRSIKLSYDRMHDFERTMQLNYFGALKLILALLPTMRARRAGHIVNVSSFGVQLGAPRFSAYVASKAALDGFSRCIAGEIHGDNVHISTVYMPLVRTPMIAPTSFYRSVPALTPEQAADLICQAIANRPKRVSTRVGNFSELAYALSPETVDMVVNTAYRMFPDSSAARGAAEADEPEEELSGAALLLARVVRGPHW